MTATVRPLTKSPVKYFLTGYFGNHDKTGKRSLIQSTGSKPVTFCEARVNTKGKSYSINNSIDPKVIVVEEEPEGVEKKTRGY